MDLWPLFWVSIPISITVICCAEMYFDYKTEQLKSEKGVKMTEYIYFIPEFMERGHDPFIITELDHGDQLCWLAVPWLGENILAYVCKIGVL